MDHAVGGYRLGSSLPFGQHVYISDDGRLPLAARTLIHELGHVFGAFHVADTRSIMHPDAGRTAMHFEFGKTAIEVFRLSRGLDLRRGVESLPPESARAIQDLYSKFADPREAGRDGPVTAGYLYQSLRAESLGNLGRTKAMAKRALDWSPKSALAHFVLGDVAHRLGHWADAERELREVTALDPKNAAGWTGLSACLIETADARGAGIAAERACELAPLTPGSLKIKAMAEFMTGNTTDYERDLETLRQVAPPQATDLKTRCSKEMVKKALAERAIRDEAARVPIQTMSP